MVFYTCITTVKVIIPFSIYLPIESHDDKNEDTSPPRFRDALKRLLTNKLFMYNFGSSLFFVLAFMGFGTFMPKYFEHQFQQKRSSSSYRSIIMVIPKAIGFLLSGFVVSR